MSLIFRKIDVWVEKGFISSQQAQDIMAFERGKKSFLSLFSIIMFLGVFSIACGVVAIVSSNWYSIPAAVKLTGMFVVLIVTGACLPRIEKKYLVGFDAGLFFFMLLLFAAIGLVGQIYHLKSDTYKAFLFWSVLAFPLLFLTEKVLFGWVWEIVFFGAVLASPLGEDFFHFIRNCFSPISFSFLCAVLFFMLFRLQKAELFVVPLRSMLAVLAFIFLFRTGYAYDKTGSGAVTMFVLTEIGFATFVSKFTGYSVQEKKALWIVAGIYAFLMIMPQSAGVLYFSEILTLLAFVFVAYCFHERKTARILAFLTALRMLAAFFDLFGSLLYTGIGMILSGVFILGIAYGCYKADGYLKQKTLSGGKGHE